MSGDVHDLAALKRDHRDLEDRVDDLAVDVRVLTQRVADADERVCERLEAIADAQRAASHEVRGGFDAMGKRLEPLEQALEGARVVGKAALTKVGPVVLALLAGLAAGHPAAELIRSLVALIAPPGGP